jgi:hypothetical protein
VPSPFVRKADGPTVAHHVVATRRRIVVKPSEIGTELRDQHRAIRAAMAETREVAVRARAGSAAAGELRASLQHLAEMVQAHNLREEELLRDVIPAIDAWGPARAAVMTDEHIGEHTRLYTALLTIPHTPAETAGVGVVALIALMAEHMDREENAFLSDVLLRDEPPRPPSLS